MFYYKEHAKEFIESTINCDMSKQYHFFEKYLKDKAIILDIGFGSGRDSLYFKTKGYEVYSIDPEELFVLHAKNIGLTNVYQLKAEDMDFVNIFDGIWACASLLHIKAKNLNNVFLHCAKALKNEGYIYASFKYGNFEGERNGRYYLDLNKDTIKTYLKGTGLTLVEHQISDDVRIKQNGKWLNVILKKEVHKKI